MIYPTSTEVYDELEYMVDYHDTPSEFVGDVLNENPNDNTTRIYIQNLNGLCWTAEGGRWPYICDTISSIQADIAGHGSHDHQLLHSLQARRNSNTSLRQHHLQVPITNPRSDGTLGISMPPNFPGQKTQDYLRVSSFHKQNQWH